MKIAVYAICKNEEKHIERWLKTTADADYQIVADTGSTDRTLSLLSERQWLGLRADLDVHEISIQPFRFDLARNAAMALIPPDVDVCVSLDLDESLAPGWRQLLEAKWEGHNVAEVTYQAELVQPFLINTRVHARAGWLWRDPCHEGLYCSGIEPKLLHLPELTIISKQDKSKPRSQYLALLKMGLDEEPWNTRRIFYYARELMCYQHFELAVGWFKKYLEIQGLSYDMNTDMDKRVVNLEVDQARKFIFLCEGAIRERDTGIKEDPVWPFPLQGFNKP